MFLLEFYKNISDFINNFNKVINKSIYMSDNQQYNYQNYLDMKMYNDGLYYYLLFYVEYFNLYSDNTLNIRSFLRKKINEIILYNYQIKK